MAQQTYLRSIDIGAVPQVVEGGFVVEGEVRRSRSWMISLGRSRALLLEAQHGNAHQPQLL